MAVMNHFYSNEWCRDHHARTQEELQQIARQIRTNCTCKETKNMGDYNCTIYINENLGLRYWIKDSFGHISEIDEERTI